MGGRACHLFAINKLQSLPPLEAPLGPLTRIQILQVANYHISPPLCLAEAPLWRPLESLVSPVAAERSGSPQSGASTCALGRGAERGGGQGRNNGTSSWRGASGRAAAT